MCVAVVVDDQERDAQALAVILRELSVRDIRLCSEVNALERMLCGGVTPDVLFIDIKLDERFGASSGIDVVERLEQFGFTGHVVYTSGFDSYHTQVYRTRHAGYLRKPFNPSDVAETWRRLTEAFEHEREQPLHLHRAGRELVAHPVEINYIESNLRRLRIHCSGETFEVYGKLGDILEQLPGRFVRCHQSFAVNLDYVSELTASCFRLTCGTEVPVSRSYRPAARDALIAHVRSSS